MDWWGTTFYYPGQFLSFYPSLARPHGNIYFGGCYLSSSLVWIMSALESSRRAVRQIALKYGINNVEYLICKILAIVRPYKNDFLFINPSLSNIVFCACARSAL